MKLRSQNYIVIVISTLHHNHVRWQLTRVVGTFGAAAFGENLLERPAEYFGDLLDETLFVAFGLQKFYLWVSKIKYYSKRNLVRAVFLVKEEPIA